MGYSKLFRFKKGKGKYGKGEGQVTANDIMLVSTDYSREIRYLQSRAEAFYDYRYNVRNNFLHRTLSFTDKIKEDYSNGNIIHRDYTLSAIKEPYSLRLIVRKSKGEDFRNTKIYIVYNFFKTIKTLKISSEPPISVNANFEAYKVISNDGLENYAKFAKEVSTAYHHFYYERLSLPAFDSSKNSLKTEKVTITNPAFNSSGEFSAELIPAKGADKLINVISVVGEANITTAYSANIEGGVSLLDALDFDLPSAYAHYFSGTGISGAKSVGRKGYFLKPPLNSSTDDFFTGKGKPLKLHLKSSVGTTTGAGVFSFWITYNVLSLS